MEHTEMGPRTNISYEAPESFRQKTKFVRESELGGVMYWEPSQDFRDLLLGTF